MSVIDRLTFGGSSRSSKSINFPMGGPEGAVFRVLDDRVCRLGGSSGRGSNSLRGFPGVSLLLKDPFSADDLLADLPLSPFVAGSKKPWEAFVVTSRMKTPSIRPGLDSTISV